MLLFSLIVTFVLLGAAFTAALVSAPRYIAPAVAAACIGFAPVGLAIFDLHSLFVAGSVVLVALVCHLRRARLRMFLAFSTLAAVGAYLGLFWHMRSNLSETGRARRKYPLESLSARLSYESRPERKAGAARPADFESLPAADRLAYLEQSGESELRRAWPYRWRTNHLTWLHKDAVEQFVTSPGFGIRRGVPDRSMFSVHLPAVDPIALPEPPDDYTPGKDVEQGRAVPAVFPPEHLRRMTDFLSPYWNLHRESIVDFAHPQTFGYIRDRDHIAGFEPHRFSKMPGEEARENPAPWQVRRLELVSLLKHEHPAVYLSKHLPRMDQLRDAPTRQLDAFEMASLPQIQKGEDLIVDSTSDRIRILGSIRAGQDCVKCHDARRGDLLGAFSYVLRKEAASR